MDRKAWAVVAIAALGSALAAWLLSRSGATDPERPASALERENSRLVAENEGLRRRLDEALEMASRRPMLVPRPGPEPTPTAPTGPASRSTTERRTSPATGPALPEISKKLSGGTLEWTRGWGGAEASGAALLLEEMAKHADLAAILRAIARDPSADFPRRAEALRALTATGLPDAVDFVREMLESGEEAERSVATYALQGARHPAFLPLLRDRVNSRASAPADPNEVASWLNAIARIKGKAWSPAQVTGEPDTPIGGDLQTAWASKQPEMGLVWLELDFPEAVRPDGVRVHETLNPGAVAQVLVKKPDGSWETVWEGDAPAARAPNWFEPGISRVPYATRTIRVVLDTDRVPGWNEIDAVELVGDGLRQWASDARASSSYSD